MHPSAFRCRSADLMPAFPDQAALNSHPVASLYPDISYSTACCTMGFAPLHHAGITPGELREAGGSGQST